MSKKIEQQPQRPVLTTQLLMSWLQPLPRGYSIPTAEQAERIIALVKGLDGAWGSPRREPMSDVAEALVTIGEALVPALNHWDHVAQTLGSIPVNGVEARALLMTLSQHLKPEFSAQKRRAAAIGTAFSIFGVVPPPTGRAWHNKCHLLADAVQKAWPAPRGAHSPDRDGMFVRFLFEALQWTGERTGEIGLQMISRAAISQALNPDRRRRQ